MSIDLVSAIGARVGVVSNFKLIGVSFSRSLSLMKYSSGNDSMI